MANKHFIVECRKCGRIVNQCRCIGEKTKEYVPCCDHCMPPEDDIDHDDTVMFPPEEIENQ